MQHKTFLFVLVVLLALAAFTYANEGKGTPATSESEKQKKTSNPLCMASEKESAIDLLLVAMVLPGVLLFIYLIHRFHIHWFPESIGVVVIGIVLGLIFRFVMPSKLYVVTQLDPKIFFVIFLPAIIFDAGYTLDKGDFFRNVGSIILYAFAGTVISTIIVASGIYITGQLGLSWDLNIVEAFMYGSLISAVDPVATLAIFSALRVNPTLHYLVFGESVVNDAVAIVLYETFEKFQHDTGNTALLIVQALIQFLLNSIGSVVVGIIFALAAALFFKLVNVRNVYYLEIAFFALFAYIPYLITLPFLSGIMCIMTSGIVMSYYVTPNLSPRSADAIAAACRTIAFISETAVFVYMGMAVFTFTLHFDFALFGFVVLLCMIGRFFNIVPLTRIVNFYRSEKIAYRDQFIMWFSGLRGAIAFALAAGWKREGMTGEILFSTTLLTVLFTIVIFGGFTFPLLKILRVKTADQMEMTKTEQTNHIVDPEKYWTQVMKGRQEHQNILTKFDELVMRKVFLRSDAVPMGIAPAVVTDSKGLSHLEKYWEGDKEKDDVDDIELQLQDSSAKVTADNDPSVLAKNMTPERLRLYEEAINLYKKSTEKQQ